MQFQRSLGALHACLRVLRNQVGASAALGSNRLGVGWRDELLGLRAKEGREPCRV